MRQLDSCSELRRQSRDCTERCVVYRGIMLKLAILGLDKLRRSVGRKRSDKMKETEAFASIMGRIVELLARSEQSYAILDGISVLCENYNRFNADHGELRSLWIWLAK